MTVAALPALAAVADSKVNPGALGFIVVALLGGATYLLIRSMTKHLRRVDFPEAKDDESPPDAGA
jgi:hypothetical protein